MKTKVYVYGLRPPTREADLVDAVMRKTHDYKNAHKEIEIDRRMAQRAVAAALDERASASRLACPRWCRACARWRTWRRSGTSGRTR
ncbi:MAG: hypothetical protein WC683_00875 [bacterium]